jgi:hypothetical protein
MPASARIRLLCVPALVAALTAIAVTSAGAETRAVSVNWAGYTAVGPSFTEVRGSWIQPAASCFGHAGSAASFWVGLGGWRGGSHKVEQIGTSADCTPDGYADHYGWYELYPAPAEYFVLKVSPGDRMSALVRVRGTKVVLQLRNLTTGHAFSKTLRMKRPDTSSANWIAEAPVMVHRKSDVFVPLTDFGVVRFTRAQATTAGGHSGPIADDAWKPRRVYFLSADGGNDPADSFINEANAAHVIPSRLSASGDSFSATWHRGRPSIERPKPAKHGGDGAL